MPGASSTNAPKSAVRVTVPRTLSPTVNCSATASHGCGLKLLHAERNLLRLGVNLQHLHLHRIAHRQHIGSLRNAVPGDIADVQQAVNAADVDERAVVREAADGAVDDGAFRNLGEPQVFGLLRFFLGHHAAVDDNIFLHHIQLRDAADNLLPHKRSHLRGIARARARRRHERAHADVHAQSALHRSGHRAHNVRAIRKRLLQVRPILRLRHAK